MQPAIQKEEIHAVKNSATNAKQSYLRTVGFAENAEKKYYNKYRAGEMGLQKF